MPSYLFFPALILLLASCGKKDNHSECLDDRIAQFKTSQKDCTNASVIEYDFKGKRVFAFSMGQCIADGGTQIYDIDCKEVCFLGGIAGFTECQGDTFSDVARQVETIWRAD